MVSITQIKEANAQLSTKYSSLTAVFVGATSGIGEGTLRAFAKHIPNPTVYIVGRSQTAASQLLSDLKEINPRGTFTYIEADVSLLRGCDHVCEEIKKKTNMINLLFQSQGYVSYAGREGDTPLKPLCALTKPNTLHRKCRWRRQLHGSTILQLNPHPPIPPSPSSYPPLPRNLSLSSRQRRPPHPQRPRLENKLLRPQRRQPHGDIHNSSITAFS